MIEYVSVKDFLVPFLDLFHSHLVGLALHYGWLELFSLSSSLILFCRSVSVCPFFFFLGLQVDRVQLACQKESEWLDM